MPIKICDSRSFNLKWVARNKSGLTQDYLTDLRHAQLDFHLNVITPKVDWG